MDISAVWLDADGADITGSLARFEQGAVYQAVITLTAKDPWRFSGKYTFSYLPGTVGSQSGEGGDEKTRTVHVQYKRTAAPTPVTPEDLAPYIPAPVRGATAAAYFSAPQYTGTVAWSTGGAARSGVFAANTAYTAAVSLNAASGYTFDGVGANAFSHTGATAVSNDAGSGVVTIVFPATTDVQAVPVDDLALSYNVSPPATGAAPVTSFAGPQYAGFVTWNPAQGVFTAGTVYTATVRLTAATGYTFNGVGANAFSHIYAPGGVTGNGNADGTYTVRIVFPVTGGAAVVPVTDLFLTYNVPAPVTGGTPPTSFAGAQYAGTIVWWEETGSGPVQHSGVFAPGTVYRAGVTLYAMAGWTFDGVGEDTFAHGQVPMPGAITNEAGSGSTLQVSITYPVTGSTPAVTDLALTFNVPAPVTGGTPVRSFAGPQYMGFVVWTYDDSGTQTLNGLFADKAYTAEVTLQAKEGWTFAGVGADSFVHGQEDTTKSPNPANDVGSGSTLQVFIKFPAAGTPAPSTPTETKVTDLILTYKVPKPAAGTTPVTYFSGPQYWGNVDWTKGGGGTHEGAFQANTSYTATVRLTAMPGYTFVGIPAQPPNSTGVFTHTNGGIVSHPEGTGTTLTVTIAFPVRVDGPLFSGDASASMDSAIDSIRANAGQTSLNLELPEGDEAVTLSAATDLGTTGLVLDTSTSPANLVIDGGGRVIDLTGSASGNPLITVGSGVTLTLRNITFKGLRKTAYTVNSVTYPAEPGDTADNTAPVVRVSGGTLILESNAVIQNNLSSQTTGGGVQVAAGAFTMNGGTISGNRTTHQNAVASGVTVAGGAFFTMNGGTISYNTLVNGYLGGGVHNAGTFTMSGGTITANYADTSRSDNEGIGGGGVCNEGTFTMYSGAVISNNYAQNGKRGGGGVLNRGNTFTMYGGVISGNTVSNKTGVTNAGGGGLYMYGGTFTMIGGVIYGNGAGAPLGNSAGSAAGIGHTIYKYSGTVSAGGHTGTTSDTIDLGNH